MKLLKYLFNIQKKPIKGLLLMEWTVVAYLIFTILMVLFTSTKLPNPEEMIWNRVRIGAITGAMWLIYRLVPCRATILLRVVIQMSLLAWWYPDTYALNSVLPNLDHHFAAWEHDIFGCQPALLFAKALPQVAVSELMCFGYSFYYPMITMVLIYYFFQRYNEFGKASFVTMAAFFTFYVIYDLVPVAGPTFYFKATGLQNAVNGVFPDMGNYFSTHTGCLPTPGYDKGIFYFLVESAKAAGERPTAAFPSSHVGIATVCMLLAMRTRSRRLITLSAIIYLPLCLSTVYIQAHYVIDAIAGLITGTSFFFLFMYLGRKEVLK